MYKIHYAKNNRIRFYLLLFAMCLYLSGCSKSKPEPVFWESESLDNGIADYTDEDSPAIPLEESNISEYILPESDSRFYTTEELSHLSAADLRLARNEIFARRGRMFTAVDLQLYFTEKSWYSPQYTSEQFEQKGDAIFNQFELANCNLIITMEQLADNSNTYEVLEPAYKDVLKAKQFRRLYVSTNPFNEDKPEAQVIDHGSYYEVTHAYIVGDVSYDQTIMDGKGIGDILELDNMIYRIKEIIIRDSGEYVDLELVSGQQGDAECGTLSRNYSDSYYTPFYYEGIMKIDSLYLGSLYFSKDCIITVSENGLRSHDIIIEDYFTLPSNEVKAMWGRYSSGLSLWGEFETDSSGVIISYSEIYLP